MNGLMARAGCIVAGTVGALAWPSATLAHGRPVPAPGDAWRVWAWDSPMLIVLIVAAGLYTSGTVALRSRAGGRAVKRWRMVCYALGLMALFVALVSPVEVIAGGVFAVHMTQHLLLTIMAAPLIALAAPLAPMLWALPPRWRRAFVSAGQRTPGARSIWRALSHPIGAWLAHALALWVWHVPVLYEAALASAWVHGLEHASFFLTAVLFWWVALRAARRPSNGGGLAVLLMITTMIQTGLLGALLTFASAPIYLTQSSASVSWGLTPLADQQLAGVIMWIPPGFVYTVAGCWLLARWLNADAATSQPRPRQRPAEDVIGSRSTVGAPAP